MTKTKTESSPMVELIDNEGLSSRFYVQRSSIQRVIHDYETSIVRVKLEDGSTWECSFDETPSANPAEAAQAYVQRLTGLYDDAESKGQ